MKQKRYGILDNISSPADLRGLSYDTLGVLCAALREFIVDSVSQTGGHLASNLGIVELAVALEREIDSSRDRIIYDVGHQCYVHKILTGRRDRFDTLRQYGGLCGFMKPEESITDPCITGHASDSVSVALGMAHARTLKNQKYHVVAVIGDGALTGGMAYEALSSAGTSREPLLVVLNDNNMSIAKHDRHIRKLHGVLGFHVIRVLNDGRHDPHLLGQHKPHTVTPQLIAHRLQDIACTVRAQIGIDENVLHHAFASSSSCA